MDKKNEIILTTGRRKTAVAKVFMKKGQGKITINNKNLDNVISRVFYKNRILEPLKLTEKLNSVDIEAITKGGGITGQVDAIRLAIARGLIKMDPNLKPILSKNKCTTRDPREKESKKYGRKRARKQFQFSKR